ncbi:MAG: UbiH/UbiF/VisC/COQ6 family ubiquinone biosynthesis hydroxylase [Pseudomonadota bacterium]
MARLHDIIIVGGGLNGSALALAVASTGLEVALVDRQPPADTGVLDGRSYALALASVRLLKALGLWSHLADGACAIQEVKASDGRSGEGASPFFLHFGRDELDDGPMGYMVEDRHLRPALLQAVAANDLITHMPDETVVAQSIRPGRVDVTTASGQRLAASVLVGSDGRSSPTAAGAGIKRFERDYGQDALVCTVAHELPHNGIAHQYFMPGGPLAILPLTGNRCSIVWSETRELAQHAAGLDDQAFLDLLRPRIGSFLGQIELTGPRFSYRLGLTMARQTVGQRLALVGDAALGVHPIAGQGLNQGLRDVGSLAEILAEAHRRGEDLGSPLVLERYRCWRSFDRTALAIATDGFNALFSNDNPILRLGRDLGMSLVSAVPGLRRGFMREAAGLSGDLPRLLRGLPL